MRIWAYHTPVTTNTSQRCTVIQHIYSTSHLGTGKNTFTPSLFTGKVLQSDPKRVQRTHKQKNDNTLHAVSKTSASNTPATALYMPLCTLWNIDTNCLHRGNLRFWCATGQVTAYTSFQWWLTYIIKVACEGLYGASTKGVLYTMWRFLHPWLHRLTALITEVKIEKGIYNANETSSVQSAGQMHWLDACDFAWSDKSIFFVPLERAYFQHCPCTNDATTTLRSSSKLDAMPV